MKEPTLEVNDKSKSKFNVQFGILYCVGIILIVAAHAKDGGLELGNNWLRWGSYHLALFAFASGYFFSNNEKRKPKTIILNKIKKFIIPLLLWNLFYGILVAILKNLNIIHYGGNLTLENLLLLPFYNGHQFIFNLASWFIVPLFVIEILNIAPAKFLSKHHKLYLLYFLICLSIGFVGAQLAINGNTHNWMLLLTRTTLFLPFFAFGLLYRKKLERHDTLSNPLYFSILFLAILATIFFHYGPVSYGASWCSHFEYFFLPFLGGALGIAFWLRVSRILAPVFEKSRLVKIISKNTFAIMMHHIFGFFLLNCLFFVVAKLTHLIEFNQESFANSVWYQVLPRNLGQFKILYVIFSIAFSIAFQLLIATTINKIHKFIIGKPRDEHSTKK